MGVGGWQFCRVSIGMGRGQSAPAQSALGVLWLLPGLDRNFVITLPCLAVQVARGILRAPRFNELPLGAEEGQVGCAALRVHVFQGRTHEGRTHGAGQLNAGGQLQAASSPPAAIPLSSPICSSGTRTPFGTSWKPVTTSRPAQACRPHWRRCGRAARARRPRRTRWAAASATCATCFWTSRWGAVGASMPS